MIYIERRQMQTNTNRKGEFPIVQWLTYMPVTSLVVEFELQSCYYVYFWTNNLGKDINYLIPTSYDLNSTTTIFSQ